MPKDKRIKWLAKQLANHYKEGIERPNGCCCSGIDCFVFSCAIWWEEFLTTYSRADIERMVRLYRVATEKY